MAFAICKLKLRRIISREPIFLRRLKNNTHVKKIEGIQTMSNKNNYTVASFFSGAGGLDSGFHKNGFDILFANDNWPDAAKTFKLNYPKVPFILKKIQDVTDGEIKKIVGKRKIDVLIGGPPCQCFTRLNNNHLIKLSEQKKEDKRRKLSKEYIRKVKLLQPKVVVMENVKDMLFRKNQEGEFYKDIIEKEFKKIGYKSYFKIISMEKYEVPQKRKRVIFLATNVKKLIKKLDKDIGYGFPKESNKIISVGEALRNIEDDSKLENHKFAETELKSLIRIKNIPQGGYYEHLPDELKTKKPRGPNGEMVIVKRYSSYFRRLHPDKPSTTITNNYIIHPTKDRYLSNREKALIHSFSKKDKFYGGEDSVSQQIANAVPPKFADKMSKKVLELLENDC